MQEKREGGSLRVGPLTTRGELERDRRGTGGERGRVSEGRRLKVQRQSEWGQGGHEDAFEA